METTTVLGFLLIVVGFLYAEEIARRLLLPGARGARRVLLQARRTRRVQGRATPPGAQAAEGFHGRPSAAAFELIAEGFAAQGSVNRWK
jgi:hypothetical protein